MKISVKVIPAAKKEEVVVVNDEKGNFFLKIKTTKPANKGKANAEVIKIIADYYKINKKMVKILSGQTSRLKLVEIEKNIEK